MPVFICRLGRNGCSISLILIISYLPSNKPNHYYVLIVALKLDKGHRFTSVIQFMYTYVKGFTNLVKRR